MITQNDPCRMIAKRILGRYLCIATKAAGLPWNEGNEAEVAEIVDDIVDAACAQMMKQMMRAPSAQPTPPTREQLNRVLNEWRDDQS
jgi:hypothetical protein